MSAHAQPAVDEGLARVALNLGAATLLAGVILAALNYVTEPIRLRNEAAAKEAAKRAVLPAASAFSTRPHAESAEGATWFTGTDSAGNAVGYVLEVTEKGFGGEMRMLVGVDAQLRVVDYQVLKHNETPGLGAKAKEEDFRKRFAGRTASQLEITKKPDPAKIQAITGATITSRAVAKGIQRELSALEASLAPERSAP